jgi:hypothetical protein
LSARVFELSQSEISRPNSQHDRLALTAEPIVNDTVTAAKCHLQTYAARQQRLYSIISSAQPRHRESMTVSPSLLASADEVIE